MLEKKRGSGGKRMEGSVQQRPWVVRGALLRTWVRAGLGMGCQTTRITIANALSRAALSALNIIEAPKKPKSKPAFSCTLTQSVMCFSFRAVVPGWLHLRFCFSLVISFAFSECLTAPGDAIAGLIPFSHLARPAHHMSHFARCSFPPEWTPSRYLSGERIATCT